jgi:integrase
VTQQGPNGTESQELPEPLLWRLGHLFPPGHGQKTDSTGARSGELWSSGWPGGLAAQTVLHHYRVLRENVHPQIVSERLGHATVGITLDTYWHVLPNLQEEAARKIDALVARTGSHAAP